MTTDGLCACKTFSAVGGGGGRHGGEAMGTNKDRELERGRWMTQKTKNIDAHHQVEKTRTRAHGVLTWWSVVRPRWSGKAGNGGGGEGGSGHRHSPSLLAS